MNKSAVFWFEFFSKRLGPGARFSKDPETFRGSKANFKINTCWIAVQFLAHKTVNFASLSDSFIVSFSKLLKLWSWMKTQQHKIAFPALKVTRTFEKQAPGARFSNVPITFQARKLFYACRVCTQEQSFNSFENGTMKLSVNEPKLTGLWAGNRGTIQQV